MLLQDKKGVSIMIGYVLLVTCAVIMGVLVFRWISTYIPTEALECPDGVSIFIKEYVYNCTESSETLTITLTNNGMFNIAGYFIHATNKSDPGLLATIDLSNYTELGKGKGGTVFLSQHGENSFEPNKEIKSVFDLSDSGLGQIYSIEVIPVRFQEEDNKMRFTSCGGSRVKEELFCYECTPATCEDLGYECGSWDDPVCGGIVDCDAAPNGCEAGVTFCNLETGLCEEVPSTCNDGLGTCDAGENCFNCEVDCGVCCPDGTCNYGETCDTCPADCGICCGDGTCNYGETCGNSDIAPECNTDCGICCGNGELNPGEGCDDGNLDDGDGCNSTCQEEDDWDCSSGVCIYCNLNHICDTPEENCSCSDCENKQNGCALGLTCQGGLCLTSIPIQSCQAYCFSLNVGYDPITSQCANACQGTCVQGLGGVCETGGDEHCSGSMPFCCCVPYV